MILLFHCLPNSLQKCSKKTDFQRWIYFKVVETQAKYLGLPSFVRRFHLTTGLTDHIEVKIKHLWWV